MNPMLAFILVLLVLGLAFSPTGPRYESRSESYASCAMPSHPTERDIAECRAWQAEKEARK